MFLLICAVVLPFYLLIAIVINWIAARVDKYESIVLQYCAGNRIKPQLLATKYEKIRADIDPSAHEFDIVDPNNPPHDIEHLCRTISVAAASVRRNAMVDMAVAEINKRLGAGSGAPSLRYSDHPALKFVDITNGNPILACLIDVFASVFYCNPGGLDRVAVGTIPNN